MYTVIKVYKQITKCSNSEKTGSNSMIVKIVDNWRIERGSSDDIHPVNNILHKKGTIVCRNTFLVPAMLVCVTLRGFPNG